MYLMNYAKLNIDIAVMITDSVAVVLLFPPAHC